MPLRDPGSDESQADFLKYCMHELGQSDTERSNEQMVAICLRAFRNGQAKKFVALTVELEDSLLEYEARMRRGF